MIPSIAFFTVIWYYSSSRNAVATQKLVQHIYDQNETIGSIPLPSPFETMVYVSMFQLLVGLCMAISIFVILRFFRPKITKTTDARMNYTDTESLSLVQIVDKTPISAIIGLLHFLGCFCTNMGFAFGSASVVQIIKLLEPVETLILTVILAKSLKTVTTQKALSMLVTISGTAILLLQKKNNNTVNPTSFFFAFCSGLCMASRNVMQKHCRHKETEQEGKVHVINWNEVALAGIKNFIQITLYASAPALICAFATMILSRNTESLSLIKSSKLIGVESIVFHGLYNIASISVLSLISAQSHSLLNVAKRICNILFAALVFNEKIGAQGLIGLLIATIGGFAYSLKSNSIKFLVNPSRKNCIFYVGGPAIFILTFLNLVISFGQNQTSTRTTVEHKVSLSNIPSTSNFVVWMFPFPPPKEARALLSDSSLICGYDNACKDYPDNVKINLKELTKNNYFHNYVCDHAYHKVRHMSDFPLHIHAITMISLLQTGSSK